MNNRKATLEYIFKKYGKIKTVNWINNYFTERINKDFTVDKCIYILDSYNYSEWILDAYKIYCENTLYDMELI